jgi:hypothetical protein
MRALAVKRVDAGEPRVRPAIALGRDAENNPYEIDLSYWPTGLHLVPPQRLAHEERARQRGYEIPPLRTLAQLEAACAAEEIRLRKLEKMAQAEVIPFPQLPLGTQHGVAVTGPFASPCLPKLAEVSGTGRAISPVEAAKAFLAWLQDHALIGDWSSEDMSKFYTRFCAENSHTPIAENVLRGELAKLHTLGARRVQADHRIKGEGRKRPVVWKIELAPSAKRRAS